MEEKFECELCLENFNQFDRKPYSLVPCGHSVCSKCAQNLERNSCPYCREIFETKVPNWEVIKRLPKPVIPIIFNQIQIKLIDSLLKYLNEYFTSTTDLLALIELINNLIEKIKNEKEENKTNDFLQRLFNYKMVLTNYRNKMTDLGNNFKIQISAYRRDIEKDENRYSEENLKKIKAEMEKLNSLINDKKDSIKALNQRLCNILNNQNLSIELVVNYLDVEIMELNQKQIVMFYHPSLVSSLENLTGFMPRNTVTPFVESNLPDYNNMSSTTNTSILTTSQKVRLFASVITILIICMIYPIAMIFMGAFYKDKCTINYLIPIWLIVSGASALLVELFLSILLIYIGLRSRVHKSFYEKAFFISFVVIPLIISIVFNFSWFIVGNTWIYSANKSVQYDDSSIQVTYCYQNLYLFSFWTLNIAYILLGIFLLVSNFFCCVYCFIHSKH